MQIFLSLFFPLPRTCITTIHNEITKKKLSWKQTQLDPDPDLPNLTVLCLLFFEIKIIFIVFGSQLVLSRRG